MVPPVTVTPESPTTLLETELTAGNDCGEVTVKTGPLKEAPHPQNPPPPLTTLTVSELAVKSAVKLVPAPQQGSPPLMLKVVAAPPGETVTGFVE
jgi:hypothetical protein